MKFIRDIVLVVVIVVIFAEFGALFVFPFLFNNKFTRSEIQAELLRGTDVARNNYDPAPYNLPSFVKNKVLHPYLGFVSNPPGNVKDWSGFYGFNEGEVSLKRAPNKVIIAITGGSVAQGFFRSAKERLEFELRKSPAFLNKEIEIAGLATGGYKQPQQLMTLSYLLTLGAEFDILINIDGFNELTLPLVENYSAGVSLVYPRLWKLYAQKSLDRKVLDLMSEINALKTERARLQGAFLNFSKSSLALILWKALDMPKTQRLYGLNDELSLSLSGRKKSYQISGPFKRLANEFEAVKESVLIWQRASVQMQALCSANKIKYVHLLQPNQYVAGSKEMGDEEKKIAYEQGAYIFKDIVKVGYPLLKKSAHFFSKNGVDFYDMTMVFANEAGPIYSDKLCHINDRGNKMWAKEVAQLIIDSSETQNSAQ